MSGKRGKTAKTAGRIRTKKRLWRWRSNPLRRHDDIVEAWIVLVMWVVILIGGAVVGAVAALAADQEFARQRSDRHAVPAVLLTDLPRSTSTGSDGYRALAKVRWTAPDGATRTGRTLVSTGLRSGTTITVWQDGRGVLTTEPPGSTEGTVEAALFGTSAALALGGLAFGTTALARWRLDRRRCDQWGREWELIGPRWDQKTG
ncbi:hypothetical protein ACH4UM_07675 [Streptomyces sp. NPDC020801]|uniref:Rv1733c family protein n=1 Tax=unclassified Streptomyces TaxID=2593676 RepID=UPI0037BD3C7B